MHLDEEMVNFRARIRKQAIPDNSVSDSDSDMNREKPKDGTRSRLALADWIGSGSSTKSDQDKDDGEFEWKTIDCCTFACFASKTLSEMSRVCNAELGGGCNNEFGIDSPYDNITETRSQIVLNASKPVFYTNMIYVDAPLYYPHEAGVGTDADSKQPHTYGYNPSSDMYFSDGKRCAACLPEDMCSKNLQGLPVTEDHFPLEIKKKGDAIWNECFRPIATDEKFKDVMNHWGVLEPLNKVNRDVPGVSCSAASKSKKRYMTVNCYSTPVVRELVHAEFKAFELLANEVNRLQMEDAKSDGIYLKARRQGTGNTLTMYVPLKENLEISFFGNLKKAKENIGYDSVE
jgi:hypothetical protein